MSELPVLSTSGYKYYLVMLDDFTRFCQSFPLHQKSKVYGHLVNFVAYVQTQFRSISKCSQLNNGTEFVNNAMSDFLSSHGILLRLSCPYTSQQNGKAKHMLRTINNTICTLLHASMSPAF
jgi:transposase InsO family protein